MRSRQIRLVVSLVVASLLATVLVYTAFAGKTEVIQVGELLARPQAASDGAVRLNGQVLSHSGDAAHGGMRIVLADNRGQDGRIEVHYRGSVPDAFRDGRAVLVDGRLENGVFVAKRDSLSTKCPSKYEGDTRAVTPASAAG